MNQSFCLKPTTAAIHGPCAVCGKPADLEAGTGVFVEGSLNPVCADCTWELAPELIRGRLEFEELVDAELDMLVEAAKDFEESEQDMIPLEFDEYGELLGRGEAEEAADEAPKELDRPAVRQVNKEPTERTAQGKGGKTPGRCDLGAWVAGFGLEQREAFVQRFFLMFAGHLRVCPGCRDWFNSCLTSKVDGGSDGKTGCPTERTD